MDPHGMKRQDIAESEGLDSHQEALVKSAFANASLLGPVMAGMLLASWTLLAKELAQDKLGRRPTLLFCCGVSSVCQAAPEMKRLKLWA